MMDCKCKCDSHGSSDDPNDDLASLSLFKLWPASCEPHTLCGYEVCRSGHRQAYLASEIVRIKELVELARLCIIKGKIIQENK